MECVWNLQSVLVGLVYASFVSVMCTYSLFSTDIFTDCNCREGQECFAVHNADYEYTSCKDPIAGIYMRVCTLLLYIIMCCHLSLLLILFSNFSPISPFPHPSLPSAVLCRGCPALPQQCSLPHSQHHWCQLLPRVLLPAERRLPGRPSVLL